MDVVWIDKIVKDDRFVNPRLVRQDLFDRTLKAKKMKTKASKETAQAFSTENTKKSAEKTLGRQGHRTWCRM